MEYLVERGYRMTQFNNTLVKRLAGTEIVMTPRVRRALACEADLWSYTLGHGLLRGVRAHHRRKWMSARAIFAMPGALCYLGGPRIGKKRAGGAALSIREGVRQPVRRRHDRRVPPVPVFSAN